MTRLRSSFARRRAEIMDSLGLAAGSVRDGPNMSSSKASAISAPRALSLSSCGVILQQSDGAY